ncbi:MAG: DUF6263 family protein [Flavobacteriaceae bacterium]
MKKYALFLFLPLLISSVQGQSVLGYHLNEGDVFTVKQIADQVIVQELEGSQHQLKNHMEGVLEFVVTEEMEDHYEISLSFKDISLLATSSLQGELMNVRATDTTDNMFTQMFRGMLNVPVKMTMARNGDVLEVVGGDSLVNKMVNSIELDDFTKNLMKKSLDGQFGSEALSQSYEQMTYFYPKEKVAVGDTWTNEYNGKLSCKNAWSLQEASADTILISGKADVSMNIEEETTHMNLVGSQTTEILTDPVSGFIRKMVVTGTSKGTSAMPQMGVLDIPTTIDMTITYELIDP